MYSIAEENYIKSIYHLQQVHPSVSTNQLAGLLQTKPASVTDMLKKLKAKKLIEYQPYYGVTLTAEGKKTALAIVRRHRLWEYFLVNSLGFEWDEVHAIAEQLEHVQEPRLIEKLDSFLGNPAYDPHGDPIPDKLGKMAPASHLNLPDLKVGEAATFTAVGEPSSDLMHMLRHKKIELGDLLLIRERFDFDQSMELLVNNEHVVSISNRLAQLMYVTPQ